MTRTIDLEDLEDLVFNFGIELMVPTDSQLLVDDSRHQNFGIWTILSLIMAIFMKK